MQNESDHGGVLAHAIAVEETEKASPGCSRHWSRPPIIPAESERSSHPPIEYRVRTWQRTGLRLTSVQGSDRLRRTRAAVLDSTLVIFSDSPRMATLTRLAPWNGRRVLRRRCHILLRCVSFFSWSSFPICILRSRFPCPSHPPYHISLFRSGQLPAGKVCKQADASTLHGWGQRIGQQGPNSKTTSEEILGALS